VVLLMLIPLLAPSDTGAPTGVSTIARALGIAAVKAWPPRYRVGYGAALRPPQRCFSVSVSSALGRAGALPSIGVAAWARRAQAVACIGVIIAGGRTLLRPIYRRIADMGNADVFAALTLLVVLGTSVLTQIAGLSLALGAFLVRARRARRAGLG